MPGSAAENPGEIPGRGESTGFGYDGDGHVPSGPQQGSGSGLAIGFDNSGEAGARLTSAEIGEIGRMQPHIGAAAAIDFHMTVHGNPFLDPLPGGLRFARWTVLLASGVLKTAAQQSPQ